MDGQHTKHVTSKLAYHCVWCLTYCKKILVGKLATFVEQEIRRICAEKTWTRGVFNIQPDHGHVFLSAPPSVASSDITHQMKTLKAVGSVLDEDGKGGYCFDRMTCKNPLDIFGFFLGSMSGPILAESPQEYEECHERVVA